MQNLFELNEIEDFYNSLTSKQLMAIFEQGAILGFSIEDRFAISFGCPQTGNHSWLIQKKMMKVDISVAECFFDFDGKPYLDRELNADDVLDMLMYCIGGVIDRFDIEFEHLSNQNF